MKKNKLIFLALSCVLLWSCAQPINVTTQNATVIKLDTPTVEGIAYPSVNYIYWSNVQNAFNGYDLRVYRKDNGKDILVESESKHFPQSITYFKDTNISDGEEKRYEIVATGDTAGRAVYYTGSSSGSVSLTGILPNLSTSPLDLEKSEKVYNPEKAYTITPENITIEKEEKFPFHIVYFLKRILGCHNQKKQIITSMAGIQHQLLMREQKLLPFLQEVLVMLIFMQNEFKY